MAGTGSGVTFKIGATTIGEITSIGGIGSEINMIDVTTLVNDGYKRFISGLRNNDDVEITGNFDLTDVGQVALRTAHDSGAEVTFEWTIPSVGAKITGDCIIKKQSVEGFEVEGVIQFKATLQINGKPTLAAIA